VPRPHCRDHSQGTPPCAESKSAHTARRASPLVAGEVRVAAEAVDSSEWLCGSAGGAAMSLEQRRRDLRGPLLELAVGLRRRSPSESQPLEGGLSELLVRPAPVRPKVLRHQTVARTRGSSRRPSLQTC
jgi:hypothetical protein